MIKVKQEKPSDEPSDDECHLVDADNPYADDPLPLADNPYMIEGKAKAKAKTKAKKVVKTKAKAKTKTKAKAENKEKEVVKAQQRIRKEKARERQRRLSKAQKEDSDMESGMNYGMDDEASVSMDSGMYTASDLDVVSCSPLLEG